MGLLVLISGFLSPLLIPIVISSELSTSLKSIISGLLAFGIPELFMVVAAGIMGKEGFNYIKRWIRILFRRYGPSDSVSRIRYRFGLVLFVIPILCAIVLPYIINVFPLILDYFIWIAITTDILLLISLFVLGGNFWDKLRGLFNQNAIIHILKN